MTDLLDRYLSCQMPVAELAAQAGVTLADLAPLDAALPGEPVCLAPHVDESLRRILPPPKPIPSVRPLIGRTGEGGPRPHVVIGSLGARIVTAISAREAATVMQITEDVHGPEHTKHLRDVIFNQLNRYRNRPEPVVVNVGGCPAMWLLTPLGEQAAQKLRGDEHD